MSALDESGVYKTPCPQANCGGQVEWWIFSGDCSGGPASSGRQCRKCKKNFTKKEWGDRE